MVKAVSAEKLDLVILGGIIKALDLTGLIAGLGSRSWSRSSEPRSQAFFSEPESEPEP